MSPAEIVAVKGEREKKAGPMVVSPGKAVADQRVVSAADLVDQGKGKELSLLAPPGEVVAVAEQEQEEGGSAPTA